MWNTAECVSLKCRQVACAFGVGKFAHQYRNYRNLFPGEGRKSLPRIHAAANLMVNQHLSLHGIGEALAPSCSLSWVRPIARQIPMMTRVLLAFAVLATAFLTWGSGSPRAAFPSNLRLSELSEALQLEAHHQGQRVVLTGTLDTTHSTIHVRTIEAVA